jgi:hypothetical protein
MAAVVATISGSVSRPRWRARTTVARVSPSGQVSKKIDEIACLVVECIGHFTQSSLKVPTTEGKPICRRVTHLTIKAARPVIGVSRFQILSRISY